MTNIWGKYDHKACVKEPVKAESCHCTFLLACQYTAIIHQLIKLFSRPVVTLDFCTHGDLVVGDMGRDFRRCQDYHARSVHCFKVKRSIFVDKYHDMADRTLNGITKIDCS